MSGAGLMRRFARWHIWLGWAAAIPLLIWTISGLFMTLRPIETVRGDGMRSAVQTVDPAGLVMPRITGPLGKLELVSLSGQPVWIATLPDKSKQRFSAVDGSRIDPVTVLEARQRAEQALAAPPPLAAVRRFAADAAPIDLRRPRPSWQASFADGTHVYVDADTGEVLAVRTRWWRAYDLMWGLHIMDPVGREDTSHALLWIFAVVALASSLLGTTLLFRRRKAVRR